MTTYIPTSEIFRETFEELLTSGRSDPEVLARIRTLRKEAREAISQAQMPGFAPPVLGYIPAYGSDVRIAAMVAYRRLRRLARSSHYFADWFVSLIANQLQECEQNALLGPLIHAPYREQQDEKYMGPRQLEYFRGVLNAWRRDLLTQIERQNAYLNIMERLCELPCGSPSDGSKSNSEIEAIRSSGNALNSNGGDRERRLIEKIEAALTRITDGTFGYCIATGKPIGIARLEQRPIATKYPSIE